MLFFTSASVRSFRNWISSLSSPVAVNALLTASETALVSCGSSPFSSHCTSASFRVSSDVFSTTALAWVLVCVRICSTLRHIPRLYSALFSNRELDGAGPLPDFIFAYGKVGDEDPTTYVHPVASAIYILSPNSCVISFMYGASPQPAQEPLNSYSGRWYWLPRTVYLFMGFSFSGRLTR